MNVEELRQRVASVGWSGRRVRRPPALTVTRADWTVDACLVERQRIVRGWSRLHLATVAHVDPKTLRDLLARCRRRNLGTVQAR